MISAPIRRIASLLCLVAALTAAPRALAQDDDDDDDTGTWIPILVFAPIVGFDYPEYLQLRTSLEAEGMKVLVAAPTMDPVIPQSGNPKEMVKPDMTIETAAKASAAAIVIVGGSGASPYAGQSVRILIEAADASSAVLAGICHGAAWTRVDGVSQILGGESGESAALLGRTIAALVRARQAPRSASPSPVLMVIANQDFYYSEYSHTRASLEAAGLRVKVAAGEAVPSYPHTGSGYTDRDGMVMPDVTVAQAARDAADYSAVVFVGGWGASSYQYGFSGTYANAAYNGSARVRQEVNDLINAFLANGKQVAAICHGVSVLAWARIDGVSPIAGTDVLTWPGYAPAELERDGSVSQRLTREQVEENGARVLDGSTIGDPGTAADNHFFNGRFLTAQDFQSASEFGRRLAELLLAK